MELLSQILTTPPLVLHCLYHDGPVGRYDGTWNDQIIQFTETKAEIWDTSAGQFYDIIQKYYGDWLEVTPNLIMIKLHDPQKTEIRQVRINRISGEYAVNSFFGTQASGHCRKTETPFPLKRSF